MTSDLQSLDEALASNERAVRQVVSGLTQAQLESQPTGGWSILQCLEHVTLSNESYTHAIGKCLHASQRPRRGTIAPSAGGRWFLTQLEPPVTRRVRAPSRIAPGSGRTSGEILRAFDQSHAKIRKLIPLASTRDLNAIKFRNPLLPLLRVRAGTGFLIMAAHERRHLWQANKVRESILGTT
ncbi:MAG: DinB family protein [Terriglobia bacterium]